MFSAILAVCFMLRLFFIISVLLNPPLHSVLFFLFRLSATFFTMAQKRKISDEKRQFKDSWELRFLVKEQSGRVLCLICNEMISVMKEYNVQRHYSTLHVTGYDKYTGEARRALLNDLKSNLRKRQEKMFQLVKPSSSTTIASYDVSLLMAKSKKAFSDGDLIKRCAIAMGKAMSFNDAARGFEKIPLSHQTVARRVEELSNFVQEKVMNQIHSLMSVRSYSAYSHFLPLRKDLIFMKR